MVNSIQSKPNLSIIASGYSMFFEDLFYADFHQIIDPSGYIANLFNKNIVSVLNTLSTKFIFTYGKKERDLYAKESKELFTCNQFKNLSNVKCIIHDAGHVFPYKEINIIENQ